MKAWRMALLALVVSIAVAGEGWHRPFAVIGPEQGVPNGGITCMVQDADGFLWLGTEGGLLRYEGGLCSRWTRKEGLPSDNIDRMQAIPSGGLWVSTAHGLVRFLNGRFESPRFVGLEDFPGVRAMALDARAHLWVATPRGLFVQGQGLQFHRHASAPAGHLLALGGGRGGAMHVGTDQGVFTFQANGVIESWNLTQGLPATGAELLAEDGLGRLWVCAGRQLVMKELGAARFTDLSRWLNAPITPNATFFKDRDGSLWLPTQKGTLCLQGTRATTLDAAAGLPMQWVRGVLRDREGDLWILGTTLARVQGNDRVWNHPLSSGPSGVVVWAMVRDAQRQLLVGTDDGVFREGPSGLHRIPGTEGRRIKGLATDGEGVLWMVGTTGPTLWLPRGAAQATVAPLGAMGTGPNSVMADASGGIWIGHPSLGILRWDPSQRRLVQEVGGEDSPSGALSIFKMREDATGRMWAASSAGLYLRERPGVWRLFTEKDGILPFGLHGMAFLPDGSAWIHSREPLGLMRIRITGDQVTVLERRRAGQGLHSDLTYSVEVDPQGRTWVSTDQGFDCLDTRLHVGRREGIISEDCDLLALLAEKDRIWVGTSAGLVRYDVGDGEAPLPMLRPHILHVLKGDQRLEPPFQSFGKVGPREASLAFRVAVPSYQHEGLVRVQVRLAGLEDAWRDLDAPLARYQAVPQGHYRFEARAAQPDGDFGPVVSLPFEVLPPWWRTWWALTLDVLLLVGLVLLIIRARLAVLARSKRELEALVARRTEELRVRNEELSTALSKVKQLSGLLPICSCCKKIRDDGGYWNQLEHYISEHSEVGFSHGICPDCVETLFPGHTVRQLGKPPSAG